MKILRTVLVGSLVAMVSSGVLAQSAGPRDLAELKTHWKAGAVWKPSMRPEQAQALVTAWARAVEKSLP